MKYSYNYNVLSEKKFLRAKTLQTLKYKTLNIINYKTHYHINFSFL